MRNLDFTVCTRDCTTKCWRKLTKEEIDWLEKNPNRQSYASFDDCEDYKLSISEQCRRAGIDRKTYYQRLKAGKTDLFAPPKLKKRHIPDHIKQILKEKGIRKDTYFARLERGWSEFEASHVLPNAETYKINGKSAYSQLDRIKYQQFIHIINEEGLSPEEALDRLNNPRSNAKYYRDGMTLFSYCKKHGLSYNVEYAKLRKANAN